MLCSNRLLGRNLKLAAGLLYPVVVVLYFALSVAAVVPLGILFALWYPGFITWNLKQQSAWKHTYFWAGWNETLATTVKYAVRYYYSVSLGFKEQTRIIRRKAWKQTYDVHPLNLILAVLVLWVGFALELVFMELLLIIKLPFLIFRATSNHISARSLWFRGCGLSLAWVAALPCMLLGPPLLLLAALPWCFSKALLAAELTLIEWGDLRPAWFILSSALKDVHVWTARYISKYDVPFTPPPQGQPVHPGYLILGLFPTILGLVIVPPVSLALVLLSIMPAMTAAWVKIGTGMSQGGVQNRPVVFLALGLLGLLVPVITPVVLLLMFVWSLLDIFTTWGVTHSKRSLTLGFQYPLGLLYRLEYGINKFAIAQDPREQVHWASLLPGVFALYAQPYMHPDEWDMGTGSALPTSIVGKPARYVPPGLRRPRYDEQGRLVDMTQALYEVPGVGVTRVDPAGMLAKGGSEEGTPRSSVESEEHAAGEDEPDPANARFPLSGKPIYGPELLPPVYKAVLAGMVVGGVVAGGLGVRTRVPHTPGSTGAGKDTSARFAASPGGGGEEGQARPEVYVAVAEAGGKEGGVGEEEEADGPAIDPNSAQARGDVAVPSAKEVAEATDDGVGCCSWMCFSEPADGYEEEDDGPELPRIRGGETLLTPALVEEVARHKHRRASLTHIDAGHEAAAAATSLTRSGVEHASAAGVGGGLGAAVDAGFVSIEMVPPRTGGSEAGAEGREGEEQAIQGQHAPAHSDAGATVIVLPATSASSSSTEEASGEGASAGSSSATQEQAGGQGDGSASDAVQAAEAAVKAAAETSSSSSAVSPAFAAAVASVAASKYAAGAGSAATSSLGSATAGTVEQQQQLGRAGDASQGQLGDEQGAEDEGDEDEDEEDDDDEEDGMFILQPVVRPALPDEWVAVSTHSPFLPSPLQPTLTPLFVSLPLAPPAGEGCSRVNLLRELCAQPVKLEVAARSEGGADSSWCLQGKHEVENGQGCLVEMLRIRVDAAWS